MPSFRPYPGLALEIGAAEYQFLPHPLFPDDADEVAVIEGGEAMVFQIQRADDGTLWALKISKPSFRGEHIVHAVAALQPYSHLPGLALANRVCLTRQNSPSLVARYPDLVYSVLMPWLPGRTWAGMLSDRRSAVAYTPLRGFSIATVTAQALWNIEAHHLAHTDVAGTNVMLSPDCASVELLDVENLYIPGHDIAHRTSYGTPGYQLPGLGPQGNRCLEGDRFAGAMLLTEMLVWADPRVRMATPEGADTLFQPHELQQVGGARWQAVRDALWGLCPPALALFDHAWLARDLAACPEISAWALALVQQ